MVRCPARSTLFPYTTLFRSARAAASAARHPAARRERLRHRHRLGPPRSEEHTSELQSLTNLVCRLLHEKKNDARRSRSQGMGNEMHEPISLDSIVVVQVYDR